MTEPLVRRAPLPAARPDAMRPLPHGGRAALGGVLGGILVLALGVSVTHVSGWSQAEMGPLEWFSLHHLAALDAFALAIAWVFAPPQAIAITVLGTAAVLIVSRSPWRAATFLVVVALSWGSSKVVKMIVARPRPDGALLAHPLAIEQSGSFPSGHVCFTAALAIGVLVMVRDTRRRTRILLLVISSGGVLVVAVSRVYLGVHYPTDVIAGIVYTPSAAAVLLWLWLNVLLPHVPRPLPGRRIAVRG
jgi:undecaprenyl-diphosphatase